MVAIRYEKTHVSKQKLSLQVCLYNACACPRHEKGGNVREEDKRVPKTREKSVHTVIEHSFSAERFLHVYI